jgi:neutral trehalase
MNLEDKIKSALAPKKAQVKRRASGLIKHDYLVPGGPYEEHWDWDAFFIGMSLAADIPSEAIYLKNW